MEHRRQVPPFPGRHRVAIVFAEHPYAGPGTPDIMRASEYSF